MVAGIWDWQQLAAVADNDDADAQISWVEGQAPSTVNDSARGMMARIAAFVLAQGGALTVGGTDSYTLATGDSHTSYVDGERYCIVIPNTSAGACTLNKDSIGAKKLYGPDGTTQLAAGDLVQNYAYDFIYDSTLDSSNGGFKLVGENAADVLLASNNLGDLDSASTARGNLGVAIGSDVQAYNTGLAWLAGLSFTNEATFKAAVNLEAGTDFVAASGGTFSGVVNINVNGSTAATAGGDELIVRRENSSCGLSLIAGNAFTSNIYFGDSADTNVGQIRYDHATNDMSVIANTTQRLLWDESDTQWEITGSLTATGTITGSSDRRLKTDIDDLSVDEAMAFVRRLRPRSFRKEGVPLWGFIAQEVEHDRYVFKGDKEDDALTIPAGAEWAAPLVKCVQHLLEVSDGASR